MRVLVISDNHGDNKVVDNILKKENYDISIHLGDSELSEKWVKDRFTYYVPGNHDLYKASYESKIKIDGLSTLILHGHTKGIYVFTLNKPIKNILKYNHYDLILHGHSHIYRDDIFKKTRVICPGSVTRPRGPEGKGYVIIEIEKSQVKNVLFKSIK